MCMEGGGVREREVRGEKERETGLERQTDRENG